MSTSIDQLTREISVLQATLKSDRTALAEARNVLDDNEDDEDAQKRATELEARIDQNKKRLNELKEAKTRAASDIVIDLTSSPQQPAGTVQATMEPAQFPDVSANAVGPINVDANQGNSMLVDAATPVIRVSEIQQRVAEHEAALDAGNALEIALHTIAPTLFKPSLLDSLWSESGQIQLALTIGGVSEQARPSAVEIDSNVGPQPDGYDAHIALIHEHASPLLFGAALYDQGDEFGFSDTFDFERVRPPGVAASASDMRAFQHRFTFSPSRYDVALSMQAIVNNGLEAFDYSSLRTRFPRYGIRFENDDATALYNELSLIVDNGSLALPELFTQLDATQSGALMRVKASRIPVARREVPTLKRGDEFSVARYRLIEANSNTALSHRVVQEADIPGTVARVGLRGSLFPRIMPAGETAGAEHVESKSDDNFDSNAEVDAIRRARAKQALAELEHLLAEYDDGEHHMLRTQTTTLAESGPFYVIDRVREYDIESPLLSATEPLDPKILAARQAAEESGATLIQGGGELWEAVRSALEARLQRHAVEPLDDEQETEFYYSEQLEEEQRAEESDESESEEALPVVRNAETIGRAKRKLEESAADPNSGEAHTAAAVITIEDRTDAAEDDRTKRRAVVVHRMRGLDTPIVVNDSDIAESHARALNAFFAFVRSEARKKAKVTEEGVPSVTHDDEEEDEDEKAEREEQEALLTAQERRMLEKQREDERRQGAETTQLSEDEVERLQDAYRTQLDAGVELVRGSTALFYRGRTSGYFGPVIGVPIGLSQDKLLDEVGKKNNWREAARDIFRLAVFYKFVPTLYTPAFPEEAVDWLLGVVRLLSERVSKAHLLFESNVGAAIERVGGAVAKLRRPIPKGKKQLRARGERDEEELAEREAEELAERKAERRAQREEVERAREAAAQETLTSAVLPPLLVVDLDDGIAVPPPTADDQSLDFSTDDAATVALIYATYARRSTSLSLVNSVVLERALSKESIDDAALAYPVIDTYGKSAASIVSLGEVLGGDRVERILKAIFKEKYEEGTLEALAKAYETNVAKTARKAARSLALAVYPVLERGERNDVKFVYLPAPGSVTLAQLRDATRQFGVLHNDVGALDTQLVLYLAAAITQDQRELADRVLLEQCTAPAYVAASTHHAGEHQPAYAALQETIVGRHQPDETPFAIYLNGEVSVVETRRLLMSHDWLGRGRAYCKAVRTVRNEPDHFDWMPFFRAVAPQRVIDWCRETAPLLKAKSRIGEERLMLSAVRTIEKLLREAIARNADAAIGEFARAYTTVIDTLVAKLETAGIKRELREIDTPARESTSDMLARARTHLLDRNLLLYVDRDQLALAHRTTLPFPGGLECDDVAALLSPEEQQRRRRLAEVWYSISEELNWFELGYLAMPFNVDRLLPLSTDVRRYATMTHAYHEIARAPGGGRTLQELNFNLAREVAHVHSARVLWFEEAFIHSTPARFGVLVNKALVTLFAWLRAKQPLAVIDYSAALADLRVYEGANIALEREPENADLVRTLDPRNQALGAEIAIAVVPAPPGNRSAVRVAQDVLLDLPVGNHKSHTAYCLDLARQLIEYIEPGSARLARFDEYVNEGVRRTSIEELLAFTRRQLTFDIENVKHFIEAGDDTRSTTEREWLLDVRAVRTALNDAARLRADVAEAPTRRARILERLREQLAANEYIAPIVITADAPTQADLADIDRAIEAARDRRDALLARFVEAVRQLARRARDPTAAELAEAIDDVFASVPVGPGEIEAPDEDSDLRPALHELLDHAFVIETRRKFVAARNAANRIHADADLQFELRELLKDVEEGEEPDKTVRELQARILAPFRAALTKLVNAAFEYFGRESRDVVYELEAARTSAANSRATQSSLELVIDELTNFLADYAAGDEAGVAEVKYVREAFARAHVYRINLINHLQPLRDALTAYEQSTTPEPEPLRLIGPITKLADLIERRRLLARTLVDADESQDIDPEDTHAVLLRLVDIYTNEYDRLNLLSVLNQTGAATINVDKKPQNEPLLLVALLLPAAIERARLQLYDEVALPVGVYELATRGDVPQALRVGELVRNYCYYGQVPLPGKEEKNVFGQYSALLARAADAQANAWTPTMIESALIPDDDADRITPVVLDRETFVEQHYTVGSGEHHRMPFGADLHMAVQWVRVMRLYLHFRRVQERARGTTQFVETVSLRRLYLTSQGLLKSRQLTRDIALLPAANDRCLLYLTLLFKDPAVLLAPLVPEELFERLGLNAETVRETYGLLPLVEEMRPIDVRLLSSLITGFDYSPLRRRRDNDPFSASGLADNDIDEDDAGEEEQQRDDDDGPNAKIDGRPAYQHIDRRFIYRRATAAKEALVDTYYRMMIDEMFTPRASDVALVSAATKRELTAADVEIVYQVVRGARGDVLPAPEKQYAKFIDRVGFERRAPRAPPVVRVPSTPAQIEEQMRVDPDKYFRRERLLQLYRDNVRDARLDTVQVGLRVRRGVFEAVGNAHTLSTGAQVHAFSSLGDDGVGHAATERALLSVAVRARLFQVNPALRSSEVLRVHREPAWHLVPRAALVGAMVVMAMRAPHRAARHGPDEMTRFEMLLSTLRVISIDLDNARHLWHDDVLAPGDRIARLDRARVQQQDTVVESAIVRPKLTPPSATITELRRAVIAAEVPAAAVVVEPVVAAPPTSLGGVMAVAAADNTQREPWLENVRAQIGRLLLGAKASTDAAAAFVRFIGTIDPPTTRRLLYEQQQLGIELRMGEGIVEALRLVFNSVRALFDDRLDQGGASDTFSEATLVSQRAAIVRDFVASIPPMPPGVVDLFWLLARTEARRRQRWRLLITQSANITDAKIGTIKSLTTDAEKGDDDDEDEQETEKGKKRVRTTTRRVVLYAYFSTLFYDAVNETLSSATEATKPRALIGAYVDKGGDNALVRAAQAFQARRDKKKKPTTPVIEVERYMPVYALLDQLMFPNDKLFTTNQLHPLLMLLLAPLTSRNMIRLTSIEDTATHLTTTVLASPLFPGGAAFEPTELRALATSTQYSADNTLITHEFVPHTTAQETAPNYIIVNRLEPLDFAAAGEPAPTLSALMQRIASTRHAGARLPMISLRK